MLQSKQRLLELNAKLAETLTDKGVTATAEETTTALVNKVTDIKNGDDSTLRGLIQRNLTELVVPYGVSSIGASAFQQCSSLTSVTIPDSVTSIGNSSFERCKSLESITIPDSVTSIGNNAFNICSSLTSVTIPDSVTNIGGYAFASLILLKNIKLSSNANVAEAMLMSCKNIEEIYVPEGVTKIKRYAFNNCTSLKKVYLPGTITEIGYHLWRNIFENDTNLEFLTLGNGFNADYLNVSWSDKFSRETIVNCFNAFADRTGLKAYTFTISKVVGNKLTDEDRAIATAKNWTIVEKEV